MRIHVFIPKDLIDFEDFSDAENYSVANREKCYRFETETRYFQRS